MNHRRLVNEAARRWEEQNPDGSPWLTSVGGFTLVAAGLGGSCLAIVDLVQHKTSTTTTIWIVLGVLGLLGLQLEGRAQRVVAKVLGVVALVAGGLIVWVYADWDQILNPSYKDFRSYVVFGAFLAGLLIFEARKEIDRLKALVEDLQARLSDLESKDRT